MIVLAWFFVLALFGLAGAFVFFRARGDQPKAKRLAIASVLVLAAATLIFGSDLAMQRLVTNLIMPAGLFWMALAAFTIHLSAVEPKRSTRVAQALLAFYTLGSNGWVASELVTYLEDQIPEYSLERGERFDAVFVLGGGAVPRTGGRDPEGTEHGDRVLLAARLYHLKKTPLLVTSGSSIPGLSQPEDLSRATAEIWGELAIPKEAILEVPGPKNTSQEIAAYKALAEERHFAHAGLVSSALHLPRALRLAKRVGLEVTPIPAEHLGGTGPFHPVLLVPHAGSWRMMGAAVRELIGMMVGR